MTARDGAIGVRTAPAADLDAEELVLDLGLQREPRDEAALLLSVAAEVEHALMVQYLYAGYSVRDDLSDSVLKAQAKGLSDRLIQLAREEMGHLMTVQNLLILVGAPVRFERENSPFESELYPFRFKLEPVSSGSLAKYVTAEGPLQRPPGLDDALWARVQEISREARRANDGRPVRHVGAIYARLIEIFADPENGLADEDFVAATLDRQAREEDWGFNPGQPFDWNRAVFVKTFPGDADAKRRAAVEALEEIAEQGEGFGIGIESHFQRFLEIYDDFNALDEAGIVYPVATNPTLTAPQVAGDFASMDVMTAIRAANGEKGLITNGRTRRWAHLLNLRYRLLLAALSHFLQVNGESYVEGGDRIGDRTPRGFLLLFAFDTMRHVKKLSRVLMTLPLGEGSAAAGPPFQLPYSLTLPGNEEARWRTHLDMAKASRRLVQAMRTGADKDDPFLADLEEWDERLIAIATPLAAGHAMPQDVQPTDFAKVVNALQEAVRGFKVAVHQNFWTDVTRDTFVAQHMFNGPILASHPQDACALSVQGSRLLQQVNGGSMPRFRPALPAPRIAYLAAWIDRQAPDNDPSDKIGVRQEREPAVKPTADAVQRGAHRSLTRGAPNYDADVRPLFRPFDKALLKRMDGIDLDDLQSVHEHAAALAARLHAGTLPYDGNWPREKIDLFQEWAASLNRSH